MSLVLAVGLFFAPIGIVAQTTNFTTVGTTTYTVPAGVTAIRVDAWGGGGGGARVTSSGNRAGGGGGAYAGSFLQVTPGDVFTVVVGGGGPGGSGTAAAKTGGNSTFGGTVVVAAGGGGVDDNSNTPGAGGSVAASAGQFRFAGGNGGSGNALLGEGAAGGGGGGTTAAGGNGSGLNAGIGGTADGGNGGAGRDSQGGGNAGAIRGGGGAAGYRAAAFGSNQNGGAGARGHVAVTVIPCPSVSVTPIENCASNSYTLSVNVTSIGSGGSLAYSVNGVPQTPVAVPTTGTYTLPPSGTFSVLEGVDWNLSNANTPFPCSAIGGSFSASCPYTLDCNVVESFNYCYGNNDTREFTFATDPGETITIRFLSPSPTLAGDEVFFQNPPYVSDAFGGGNGDDLFDIGEFISDDNEARIRVATNATGSCQDGALGQGWTFEVLCTPSCVAPLGSVFVTNDCANEQFSFDVTIEDPGDASTVGIRYSVDGGPPVDLPDQDLFVPITLGPFSILSSVVVTLIHEDEPLCNITLPVVTRDPLDPCTPVNALCANATPLTLNGPGGCPANAVAGRTLDGGSVTANPACGPNTTYQDVWYSFNSGNVTDPIVITVTPGTVTNYGVQVFSACGGTPILCTYNQSVTNFNGSGVFENYLIRVFSTTAGAGSFTICLNATPVPNICGTTVYDSGGPGGNYANNENYSVTYCPNNPGESVIVTFTQFDVENNWDKLYIFNGPNTSSPKFDSGNGPGSGPAPFGAGGWWGQSNAIIPGPFQSTHPSGCITFHFSSDGTANRAGWTANLVCCTTPNATAAPTSNSPVCVGGDIELEANSPTGTVFTWTGPAGFNSTAQNPVRSGAQLAWSGNYTVVARNGANGCPSAPAVVNVQVVGAPPPVQATASVSSACVGDQINLFAALQTAAFQDGFDPSPQAGWTSTNTSTGGNPAAAAWTIRNGAFKGMNSNSGNYYVTDSDGQGSGGVTNTTLTTPAIDLSGYPAPVLTFRHRYRHLNPGFAVVEASTNLSTWTTLATYNSDQGAQTNFATVNLSLGAFGGQPTVYVRFRYFGEFSWYWGIDDVAVNQNATVTYAWESSPAGFTSTVQNPTGVTINTSTTYTVTASSAPNCSSSGNVTVLTGVPFLASVNEAGPFVVCDGLPFSATSSASGGGLPYTYEWTLNSQVVGTTADLINFVPTASGTLTLVVTDNCGDFVTINRSVVVNPLPNVQVAPVDPFLCGGGAVNLSATGASTYSWAPATYLNTTTGANVTATLPFISPEAIVTYTVSGTDGNGCVNTAQTTASAIPPAAAPGVSNYAICEGNTVPGGQGLQANCTDIVRQADLLVGTNLVAEGTTITTRATITVPPLPPGAVITQVRLRLANVVANGNFLGNSNRANIRVALTGMYTLGETQLTTETGTGTVNPNPLFINLAGFPTSGGTLNFRTRMTSDQFWTDPDANFGSVNLIIDYVLPVTTEWFDAPVAGTLVSSSAVFDPVGASLVDNNTAAVTTFYARCRVSGCESVRIPANFSVVAPANAGANGSIIVCSNGANFNLFPLLNGTPDGGGTWTGPSAVTGDLFTPGTMAEGVYTYTVISNSPCPPITATVTVTYDLTDSDGDGVIDCFDDCPFFPGVQGQFCDANLDPDVFQLGLITEDCECVPQNTSEDLLMVIQTDANPDEITWEITPSDNASLIICAGSAPSAAVNQTVFGTCSLPVGCFTLRVFDDGGDGMTVGNQGGYVLRYQGAVAPNQDDKRIIDNTRNFNGVFDGSLSAIGNGPSAFCLPMSAQKPLYHHRDRLDFVSQQYLVCEEDLAVSAQWEVGDQTLSGYQFWFYDPNGSYSFRRGRNHATSDGFANIGPTRTCHMKINNWAVANQIPENVLMNVRIRTRVNGTYGSFGPAYRFKIDPVRAQCPLTKLLDYSESQFESCNQTRNWGTGNWVHARAVQGANRYQWRFRIPAENFVVAVTSNNYFLQLNWTNNPLEAGKTYVVDVRASKDFGATWCSNFIAPALNPWGDLCNLTIGSGAQGDEQNLVLNNNSDGMQMWPNPNRSEQLWLNVDGIEADVQTVTVDIFDMTGKRIVGRIIPTQGDRLNTVLDLNGDLAAGLYMVNVTAGNKTWNERLVIAR